MPAYQFVPPSPSYTSGLSSRQWQIHPAEWLPDGTNRALPPELGFFHSFSRLIQPHWLAVSRFAALFEPEDAIGMVGLALLGLAQAGNQSLPGTCEPDRQQETRALAAVAPWKPAWI